MRMRANYILVDPEMWTESKIGVIVVPKEKKAQFARGVVKEVGPGLYLANGKQVPIEVDVGDHILYFHEGAAEIVVHGKTMHIVQERQILAILEPDDFGETKETSNAAT